MLNTLQVTLPLSYLMGAAIFFYIGTHLVWRAFGGHQPVAAFARGMVLGSPLGFVALWLATVGLGSLGVAVVMTGAVVMVSLALGVTAMSVPGTGGVASPSLRLIAPLALAAFLAGCSGQLDWSHALLIAVVALSTWFMRPEIKNGRPIEVRQVGIGIATICFLVGAAILWMGIKKFLTIPTLPPIPPVIVPLTVLASVGLLVGDVHSRNSESAVDTVVGAAFSLLGIVLPLVIVVAIFRAPYFADLKAIPPVPPPLPFMPMATWRIDSVLLVVLSALLYPASTGKSVLGRVEGMFLVLVCAVYMVVTVVATRM